MRLHLQGMQYNPGIRTIEGELCKAMCAAGCITPQNARDPTKVTLPCTISGLYSDLIILQTWLLKRALKGCCCRCIGSRAALLVAMPCIAAVAL